MRTAAGITAIPESSLTEPNTLLVERKNLVNLFFGAIRREAADGIHVRLFGVPI